MTYYPRAIGRLGLAPAGLSMPAAFHVLAAPRLALHWAWKNPCSGGLYILRADKDNTYIFESSNIMPTCCYYWLFAPLREEIDDSKIKPSFEIKGEGPKGYSHVLSLFCDKVGDPHFARLKIDGLPAKNIPAELFPLISNVEEHLVSVLRLTYRPDFMLAKPPRVWAFIKDDSQDGARFSAENFGKEEFNAEVTRDLFVLSFDIRELFNLYSDGGNEMIPLQYRFISYYKILELEFREQKIWKHKEIDELFRNFEPEFKRLGYSKKPIAIIHELRDRCAHIRTGKGKEKEVRGVTHLNHAAAMKVAELIPIMKAMCAAVLNKHAQGKFELDTSVSREKPPGRIDASDKEPRD